MIDGPDVKMIHVYECREDHFIDTTCPDPGGQQQHADTTYQRVWSTDASGYNRRVDKFFWDFSFRWQAAGIEDCCFIISKQSSFSYVCHTTKEEDPGSPCSFVEP